MSSILITASSENSQDITVACQIVDAVTLQGKTVQTIYHKEDVVAVTQTIYHKEGVVAVTHDRRREISSFWLVVLFEDVQVEVNDTKFLRQKVALQWINQTSDPLTYTGTAYLSDQIERVQKRVSRILFSEVSYSKALEDADSKTLFHRREELCSSLFKQIVESDQHKLAGLLPAHNDSEG